MSRPGWRRRVLGALAIALPAFGPGPAGAEGPPLPAAAAAAPCPPAPQPMAAPLPRDRGLLWRLQRDGRSSWLYGTLHLGRADWALPGPAVAAALARSDVLAVELDPGDPAVAAGLAAAPPVALPPALQARLARAAERACLPALALAALHPVLQASTLVLLDARWLGLHPQWSQEALLLAQARERGLPVLALETAALQLGALLPAPGSAVETVHAQVAQALQQLDDGSARRTLGRLAEAWAAGDLAELEQHAQWCECVHTEDDQQALRRLNDERNPGLAAAIAARHAQGQRVFAAVGALHMTGPQALPQLLRAQGFVVERVPPGP